MGDPITLTWELHTPAPIERTWALLSDTDQFNRVAGLGFRFEDTPQADGTVKRVGRARFLGTEMSWEESPFQYRVPEWFRCTRRFHGTPASEVVSSLRLRSKGEGTEIRYSIAVEPRGLWARPLVWGELQLRTKPKIDHALSVFLAQLSGTVMPEPTAAPPLSPQAEKQLDAALGGMKSPELARRLGEFIRTAPLRDQNRIAPLKLAKAWAMPENVVIAGLLDGVRRGALSLTWDLLCPACQGPATRLDKLNDPGRRVHCTSCNVYFDATFPDSVAVTFKPAPALRALDVPTECAGSPARQPHIVASERLAPGEQAEISLLLDSGAYRLRTWPPLLTASLEVSPALTPTALELVATRSAIEPARLRAHPGELVLRMRNDGPRALDLVLEKRERAPDVLTAGRLLEMPNVKDLLPEQAIDPAFSVESMRASALLIPSHERNPDPYQRGADLLRKRNPRQLILGQRGTLAIFASPAEAWQAAAVVLRAGEVGCAVSTGPILEVHTGEDEVVPMGAAVDEALRVSPLVSPEQVVVPGAQLSDEDTLNAIREAGLRPVEGVAFEAPGTGRAVFFRL